MDETFELPVNFNGNTLHFPAQLQQLGYTHRFLVDVNGEEVIFEPDEERCYRALVDPETTKSVAGTALLKAIAESIEALLK